MRRSALTITYADLQKWVRKQAEYSNRRKKSSIERGVTNQEALTHDVACAETLMRMLDRCEPGRQANFFELFEQVKK